MHHTSSTARPRQTFSPLLAWVLAALLILGSTCSLTEANMFSRTLPKLKYDVVSIANSPSSAQNAEVVQAGSNMAMGEIIGTVKIPKDGVSVSELTSGSCQWGIG